MFLHLGSAESGSSFDLEKSHRISINESSGTEFNSPTFKKVMELDNEQHQQSRKWEKESSYMSQEEIESLPTVLDEEVIGIITMEDVMEELLQVLCLYS